MVDREGVTRATDCHNVHIRHVETIDDLIWMSANGPVSRHNFFRFQPAKRYSKNKGCDGNLSLSSSWGQIMRLVSSPAIVSIQRHTTSSEIWKCSARIFGFWSMFSKKHCVIMNASNPSAFVSCFCILLAQIIMKLAPKR